MTDLSNIIENNISLNLKILVSNDFFYIYILKKNFFVIYLFLN